jgi:hypothetical protein
MKALAVLLLAALGLALPHDAVAHAEKPTADEVELRELKEVLWPKAYREGDAALLDRLLAEEFRMIDPEGGWSHKAAELEGVVKRGWVNRGFRFEILRLDVFQNGTAIVAGRGIAVGPASDPDGGYQYHSSNVLICRDDRWQAISSHVSGFRPLTKDELAGEGFVGRSGDCASSEQGRAELLALSRSGFEILDPAERSRRALQLTGCLGEPDPALRDGVAFTGLSKWLRAGAIDAPTRLALAERLLPWVEGPEDAPGFRRTFAALALSEVARADRLAPSLPEPVRHRIAEAAARFLETTRDHRGFDQQEGWRHAVAHGADLALQIGLHPATTELELRRILTALATQVAPSDVSYIFGEPERFARTVYVLHRRGTLGDGFWDGWFSGIGSPAPLAEWSAAFETEEGLARRHNVLAFLHAVGDAARSANASTPPDERLGALAKRELDRVTG